MVILKPLANHKRTLARCCSKAILLSFATYERMQNDMRTVVYQCISDDVGFWACREQDICKPIRDNSFILISLTCTQKTNYRYFE